MKFPLVRLVGGREIERRKSTSHQWHPFVHIARSASPNEVHHFNASEADDYAYLAGRAPQLWRLLNEVKQLDFKPNADLKARIESILYELKTR